MIINRKSTDGLRFGPLQKVLSVMLLATGMVIAGVLIQQLIGQIYYHRAQNRLHNGEPAMAIQLLSQAVRYMPQSDSVHKLLGRGYQQAGSQEQNKQKAWSLTLQSKACFRKALTLNPLDAETAYCLALVEARLERLFPLIQPQRRFNPFKALPRFDEAIRLFPNAPGYHLAKARYVHRQNRPELLHTTVQSLIRIYPGGYTQLAKERFWSESVKMAAKAGLQQAISDGIDLRTAHEKLSDLLVTEENWSDALEHYRRAIEVPTATNTSGDYCHLGWLYLKNARYTEAEIWFFTCLDTSHDRERDISDICREYQPVGAEALMAFFTGVRGRYPLTTKMELALARSLIALKHINQAEDILIALAQRDPSSANVHYLLSRIAEIQKDWDRMELAIQKATVLDPTNLQYRQIFYDLLKRMGKLSAAEQELDRIIAATQNPGLQILEERAQMRWNRKDYPGAIQGWEEGLKIAPTRANLHANIAEAHIKLGNLKQAIAHYQKALTLDPQNKQYQQKIRDLDA